MATDTGMPPMSFTIHKPTQAAKAGISITATGATLKITSLAAGGLAAASGLQVGDTVQTINGRRVKDEQAATAAISFAVGDVVVGVAQRTEQPGVPQPPVMQQPSGKFDPMTGQPVAPQPPVMQQPSGKFDPMTGQPVPKFDPLTGMQNWWGAGEVRA